MLFINFRYYVN